MARGKSKGYAFYKCTKSFQLPLYDEDGHENENKKCVVLKGDIFHRTNDSFIGGEVHLEDAMNGNWIEISKAKLAECFSPKDGDGDAD